MRKPKPTTLNEMTKLRESGFGQQYPRHGLKLLHWFARECFTFDTNNEMLARCKPSSGVYGFHLFENRSDENLLPVSNFPYYEVGNLKLPGADKLPDYVRKDYTGFHDKSNVDRIIVRLHNEKQFDRVYVTEHDGPSTFSQEHTFRISRNLLKMIRKMDLDTFLEQAGYSYESPNRDLHSTSAGTKPLSTPILESASNRPNNKDFAIDIEPAPSSLTKSTDFHTKPTTRCPKSPPASRGFWENLCTIL
ncbi:uncharacterized protein LOC115823823 [Chanos chanos]|uniref:Uncharacterized protein LOC115823823 n=1 Tax=Chanos chanos TaxID=29144 RepID=A0A6J2WK62_CHACN|nr:uncharacterized protein LOC115823823 [Chanos chanos]